MAGFPDLALNAPVKRRHTLERYGIALALASLSLLIREALPATTGTSIYQLPLAAVLLSGWFGGRGPGLFALLICATGILYWFIPPADSFSLPPDYATGFGIFICLGLLLTEFSGVRRRVEQALRTSEERFRALVQFSFNVWYWETDAQHRFTRLDLSDWPSDAPPFPSAQIGKTRWEHPYVNVDEQGWREHRATIDAHLPFRDFERAIPTADGGRCYHAVSGLPVFDEAGRFVGYRGVGRDITDRKRAEAEHRAHVWFLESMDRINRAMQATNDVVGMMGEVLEAVLAVFACDRAWVLYPCDPHVPSWRVVMEHTRPEFSCAAARGRDLPMTADSAEVARAALDCDGALPAGPGHERQVKQDIAERFDVRSEMLMALHPKGDRPYLFGVHQCSRPRLWTKDEQRLFEDIGHRLTDALSSLIAFRSLRESEARFRTFVDRATDAFFLLDEQLKVVDVNRQACDSLGYGREDLIGKSPRDFDAGLDEPAIGRLAERASAGETLTFETRHRRKDGTVFPVEIRSGTFKQAGKLFYLALARDITERKRAEDSLRQSEMYLAEAQRLSHTGSWALDVASDKYVYTSEESDRIYGFDPQGESPTREAVFERIHPDDRSRCQRNIERALREKVDTLDEYRIVLPDGTVRHIRAIRHPVLNDAGEIVQLIGTSIDITERKRAEESLRQSEAYLAEAQRLSHTGSWALDVSTNKYIYTSDEFDRMYGFDTRAQPLTREVVVERIHPEDRSSWKQTLEKSRQEKVDTFHEYRIVLPDGDVRHIHVIRHPVLNDAGEVVQLVGTSIDITERKLAEEALRVKDNALQAARTELAHVSRLTTLGELTASIAHEVSQPLGAMTASAGACARWLAAEPPDMGEARRALDNIVADGKRAREVIARIRSLTKRQAPRMELLDINRKVLEVVALTEYQLRSHQIVLQTRLDTTLPRVAGDRVQLQQVLLNLIVNAIEAMSGLHDRARELTIVSQRQGDIAVVVEVRDSGTGLDNARAEHLFDAFYTTKAEGLGIGLSISRSIVEAHGGQLWASSNEPHGAVFRFSLPVIGEAES